MAAWKELERFCRKDGWECYKDTDHLFFRKIDDDGNIRRTKVSKGTGEIPAGLFNKILKQQLGVSKEYFNKKI